MVKALAVVAMMHAYVEPAWRKRTMIRNQLKLIDEFHRHGLPVIVIKMDPKKKRTNPVMLNLWGDLNPYPETRELIPEIKAAKKSKVITKTEYSSFFRTELGKYCRDNHIDEMYFTGVNSDVCVFFSAVDAAYRRIQPYLVSDASSTDRKDWHERTCNLFEGAIGPVVTTEEVIDELGFCSANNLL